MKVVIVDDEWYSLDITYRMLTQVRVDLDVVAFFQDPVEALEKIPALHPNLVILDAEMPHINGLELYEKLKSLDSRFLLVSAHGDVFLKRQIGNARVKFLAKPFSKTDMSSILESFTP